MGPPSKSGGKESGGQKRGQLLAVIISIVMVGIVINGFYFKVHAGRFNSNIRGRQSHIQFYNVTELKEQIQIRDAEISQNMVQLKALQQVVQQLLQYENPKESNEKVAADRRVLVEYAAQLLNASSKSATVRMDAESIARQQVVALKGSEVGVLCSCGGSAGNGSVVQQVDKYTEDEDEDDGSSLEDDQQAYRRKLAARVAGP